MKHQQSLVVKYAVAGLALIGLGVNATMCLPHVHHKRGVSDKRQGALAAEKQVCVVQQCSMSLQLAQTVEVNLCKQHTSCNQETEGFKFTISVCLDL